MKKLTFIMMFLVIFAFLFSGCKKPQGTFSLDNYTDSDMYVDWCGYSMSVSPYEYSEYTVNAGGGTATVESSIYGYWGSIYIEVPKDGINGVEIYWSDSNIKSSDNKKIKETKGNRNTAPKEKPSKK